MFFSRTKWIRLGTSEQAVLQTIGDRNMRRVYLEQTNICLVNSNGKLKAVRDRCPHQGAKFSEGGCVEDNKIVCPWHKFGFDLDNGRGAGLYVEVYPIEMREDGVYLGFQYRSFF